MYMHHMWGRIPMYPGWFYFHTVVSSGKINMMCNYFCCVLTRYQFCLSVAGRILCHSAGSSARRWSSPFLYRRSFLASCILICHFFEIVFQTLILEPFPDILCLYLYLEVFLLRQWQSFRTLIKGFVFFFLELTFGLCKKYGSSVTLLCVFRTLFANKAFSLVYLTLILKIWHSHVGLVLDLLFYAIVWFCYVVRV